jgi:hypothetical protein
VRELRSRKGGETDDERRHFAIARPIYGDLKMEIGIWKEKVRHEMRQSRGLRENREAFGAKSRKALVNSYPTEDSS